MPDNEYPKISGSKGWARIDFSGRSFAHFVQEDDEDEQPRFFSVGRDENNDRTSVSFEGLTNNDLRRFAEEILRQFPETTPEPLPEYEVVIDLSGDEWVKADEDVYVFVLNYGSRKNASETASGDSLFEIAKNYGVKDIRTVTGEEAR